MDDETKATFAEHDRRIGKVEERVERQREEIDRLLVHVRHLADRAPRVGARPRRAPA